MLTWDEGMDAVCFFFFFFFFFLVCYLNCVICSDVGSPLNPEVQALWVKQHQMRQNTKARVSFWWSKNVAKFYRKVMELLYVEAAAVFSFTKNHLTVWPLYAQKRLQRSELRRWSACKLSHSMFAAWFSVSDWPRKKPASVLEEVAKLLWLAVLLTFSTFYLDICVFVDRGNLAESVQLVISTE